MRSLFQKPKLKAQSSRNAFDRSSGRAFTAPFGALLPFFCARVNPDDYVELSCENQLICEPLVKPAFMRLKEHLDYYFVPYSQLWMPFENFVLGQDSFISSSVADMQNNSIPAAVPYVNGSYIQAVLDGLHDEQDEHGYSKYYGACRLLDALRYGNVYDAAPLSAGDNPYAGLGDMNLFSLLAYQKVYYDFYRNPLYERNQVDAYNIDDLMGTLHGPVAGGAYTPDSRDYSWFTMHYRWCKKDYFMDVRPYVLPTANQIGYTGLQVSFANRNDRYFAVPGSDVVPANVADSQIRQTQIVDNSTVDGSAQKGGYVKVPSVNGPNSSATVQTGAVSVTGIRLAFAVDKLMRRQREAGAVFDRQMLAQFGIVPRDERHGKCYFIGGQTNRLYASDITNMSETGSQGLGQLAGQINVFSPSRKTFKYHCKEHGLIIGIYSTSLDNIYPSFVQDRGNLSKFRFDWFNPVFDRLGLQPIFKRELNLLADGHYDSTTMNYDPSVIDNSTHNDDILGYVRRYADYKTGIDTAHNLFANPAMSADDAAWVPKYHAVPFNPDDKHFSAPLTKATMTLSPATFNDVAGVPYNGQWSTDPFKISNYTHFKCVSNMDVIGEDF